MHQMMGSRLPTTSIAAAVLLLFASLCLPCAAMDVRYWVWHRTAPLSAAEIRSLSAQGVTTVYWHAATLRAEGEGWRLDGQMQLPKTKELDAYLEEYPDGRYVAEMRLWRGAASINIGDWNTAVDLLTAPWTIAQSGICTSMLR